MLNFSEGEGITWSNMQSSGRCSTSAERPVTEPVYSQRWVLYLSAEGVVVLLCPLGKRAPKTVQGLGFVFFKVNVGVARLSRLWMKGLGWRVEGGGWSVEG